MYGPIRAKDGGGQAQPARRQIGGRIIAKDEKRKSKEGAQEFRHVRAKKGAKHTSGHNAEQRDHHDKLKVVDRDTAVSITERLQKADLLALECNEPGEREIDEKSGHQQEDRRQRAAHVVEHVELVIEPRVGRLVLASIRRTAPVRLENYVEPLDDILFRGVAEELEADR